MSSKINTQSNMCEVKWYYHFHQIGPLDRFGLVVVMSINIYCMYVCMYMYVPFSYQLFQGLSSGPDDLNKLFMVDLWSIFMKYPDLRVGIRVWWPHSKNCEIYFFGLVRKNFFLQKCSLF